MGTGRTIANKHPTPVKLEGRARLYASQIDAGTDFTWRSVGELTWGKTPNSMTSTEMNGSYTKTASSYLESHETWARCDWLIKHVTPYDVRYESLPVGLVIDSCVLRLQ